MNADKEVLSEGVTFSTFLKKIMTNKSVHSFVFDNLQNNEIEIGTFEMGTYRFHINMLRNENGGISHYELLIADNNSDENGKKRMSVLTAKSYESELVEMDCSGMRENEVIDLNEEGRRWEGCELNGKPFGFGREYSENDNLVYEGFVFEGMRVCAGREWNNDENNNCLVYEGG